MDDFFKYLWYNAKIMDEKPADEETQAAWAKWAQSGYDKYNQHGGNIFDRTLIEKRMRDLEEQKHVESNHASDANDWNVGQYGFGNFTGFGGRQYGKTEANRRAMDRQPKVGKWTIVTPGCNITIDWGEQKRKLLYEKWQYLQSSRSDRFDAVPAPNQLCLLGTYVFPCTEVLFTEIKP